MSEKTKITFYVNKDKGKTTCVADILGLKYQNSVKTMEGDSYNFAEGLVKSLTKTLLNITYGRIFKDASVEVKNVGKEPIYETQKDLHGLDINGLHFNFSGVDGIYVLDHIAFECKFDEDNNNDWEKSSSNRVLHEWASKILPREILNQYYVDIPTVEEVFSQKEMDMLISINGLKSRQFPLFSNLANRMLEFVDEKPIIWCTSSSCPPEYYSKNYIFAVHKYGFITNCRITSNLGFVPVLRRRGK